jgi:chromosome segregation ATPase
MNRQVTSVLVLGLAGAICGCATTGYQRASQTGSVINEARAVVTNIQQNIDAAARALQTMTGPDATELRQPYQTLSAAVTSLDIRATRLSSYAQAFQKKSNAYLKAWQEELGAYQSPTIRNVSAERRDAVVESFKKVSEQFQAADESTKPLRVYLKDMRRYLGTDLTAAGVASGHELARRITELATEVEQRLQSLLAELNRVETELSPMKPGTETPAEAK